MKHFLVSATQFVLVIFAVALASALLGVVYANLSDHDVIVAILALFSNVIVAVISFYFGQKSIPPASTVDTSTMTVSTTVPSIKEKKL